MRKPDPNRTRCCMTKTTIYLLLSGRFILWFPFLWISLAIFVKISFTRQHGITGNDIHYIDVKISNDTFQCIRVIAIWLCVCASLTRNIYIYIYSCISILHLTILHRKELKSSLFRYSFLSVLHIIVIAIKSLAWRFVFKEITDRKEIGMTFLLGVKTFDSLILR